jgi:hypothetical protein
MWINIHLMFHKACRLTSIVFILFFFPLSRQFCSSVCVPLCLTEFSEDHYLELLSRQFINLFLWCQLLKNYCIPLVMPCFLAFWYFYVLTLISAHLLQQSLFQMSKNGFPRKKIFHLQQGLSVPSWRIVVTLVLKGCDWIASVQFIQCSGHEALCSGNSGPWNGGNSSA